MRIFNLLILLFLLSSTTCVGSFAGFKYLTKNHSVAILEQNLKNSSCEFIVEKLEEKGPYAGMFFTKNIGKNKLKLPEQIYRIVDSQYDTVFYLFLLNKDPEMPTEIYTFIPKGSIKENLPEHFEKDYAVVIQKQLKNCF